MIDTLTISRELTKAGIPSAHADAIATGIQQAADHGRPCDRLRSPREIVTVGIVLTVAGLQTAAMFAILRLLDR